MQVSEAGATEDTMIGVMHIKGQNYKVRVLMDADLDAFENGFTATQQTNCKLMRGQI